MQQLRIGLGCVNIGSATSNLSSGEQVDLIHQAIDAGVNHFDTADAYGNGMSERILGKALRNRREEVTISTKGGYLFRERSAGEQRARRVVSRVIGALPQRSQADGPSSIPSASYQAQEFSEQHLRSAVHASLRRLGSDHIDVYLLHGPPNVSDYLFEALADLKTSGKVGKFGVGAESISSAAAWCDVATADVIQLPFGLLDADARSKVFNSSRTTPIEMWARGVLGGGLFSAAASNIDALAGHPKQQIVNSLVSIAEDAGLGVDELAIRWIRSSAEVDLVLLGMSSSAHLKRNVALAALPPLPQDVLALVESTVGETVTPEQDDA